MDFLLQTQICGRERRRRLRRTPYRQGRQDLVIRVPEGTVIRDAETSRSFRICPAASAYAVLASVFGWGNQHFATPHPSGTPLRQAGLPGQSRDVVLS